MRQSQSEAVLDQMHSAIMRADFAGLGALAPLLEQVFAADLAAAQAAQDLRQIQRLAAKSARNEAGLLAAARGVRSAQRRLQDLRETARGLITYDGQGKRHDLGSHTLQTRRF